MVHICSNYGIRVPSSRGNKGRHLKFGISLILWGRNLGLEYFYCEGRRWEGDKISWLARMDVYSGVVHAVS